MSKTLYRRFEVAHMASECRIIEHQPSEVHPMNWGFARAMDGRHYPAHSREAAWASARSQDKPVVVECLGEEPMNLGVVFDVEAFERAAYGGYVSYGHSMSDGYYAPLSFESWAASARKDMARELAGSNDAALHVKESLPTYLERTR
jgi:hypothetical protein